MLIEAQVSSMSLFKCTMNTISCCVWACRQVVRPFHPTARYFVGKIMKSCELFPWCHSHPCAQEKITLQWAAGCPELGF